MPMKAAIYIRVSTDEQDASNQRRELAEWITKEGHVLTSVYQDIASGARRREHLDDLYDDARRKRFEIVGIWSLDRLTREGPLATLMYLQRLTALGVKVYSHQEPYLNPALPFYESIVAFLADIARWERERLSERTKAGVDRARASGKQIGRPPGRKDARPRTRRRTVDMRPVRMGPPAF